MPKIGTTSNKLTVRMDVKKVVYAPPPEPDWEAISVPWPEERVDVLNLQTCECDHDRTVHSTFVGEGDDQRLITCGACVGPCRVRGCGCRCFRYSAARTSEEGRRRRAAEVKRWGDQTIKKFKRPG